MRFKWANGEMYFTNINDVHLHVTKQLCFALVRYGGTKNINTFRQTILYHSENAQHYFKSVYIYVMFYSKL